MRTRNTLKNLTSGFAGQVIYAVLGFVVRTVFIKILSESYLGINSLLSSIFTVLNLANLGIDNAIIFAMYKPMAEGNTERLKSLVGFYRRSYQIIGFVLMGLGLCLLPFLDVLTHGSTTLVNLRVVYLLMLSETVFSYWFFAYLSSVPTCDQKQYIITRVGYVTDTLSAVARIILLLLLRNNPVICFYVYTAVGIVARVLGNYIIRCQVRKDYPWTKEGDVVPLTKEEKRPIFKNVTGMMTNNVCRVLNDGIDSTIVSSFLGLEAVGIFSNYLALRSYVLTVLRTVFNSLSASVGNLCAVESKERQEQFFKSLQFICFWVYGFGSICFVMLLDSFIAGVWLKDTKWLLSKWDVLLISVNFLIEGMAKAVITFRDAKGLFWQTRFRYLFSSIFNAVVSIVLVGPLHLGVTGALLGTTASLIIMVSYDPILVYREIFEKRAKEFYCLYFKQIAIILVTGAIVWVACRPFSTYTFGNFVIRLVICIVIPNGLWYIVFRKKTEFQYLKNTLLGLIHKGDLV